MSRDGAVRSAPRRIAQVIGERFDRAAEIDQQINAARRLHRRRGRRLPEVEGRARQPPSYDVEGAANAA